MPSYVVKPTREEDFYVYWSEIVEAPVMWGNRAETLAYLASRPDSDRTNPVERLDRADQHGSSALWPRVTDPIYGWNDSGMIYQQQGYLPRTRLREMVQRFTDANPGSDECVITPDVSDLLEPFED